MSVNTVKIDDIYKNYWHLGKYLKDTEKNFYFFENNPYNVAPLTEEEKEYLDEMISFQRGEVTFLRDGFYETGLYGDYLRDHSEEAFSRVRIMDAGFYANTFKHARICDGKVCQKHSTENLFRVKSFAIDLDYRRDERYKDFEPLTMYEQMLEDGIFDHIPPVSYIEYGHQMRLIYVLREPISVCQRGGKTALKTIKAIQRRICDIIQADIGTERQIADCQPLASFYRLPGSYNSKEKKLRHHYRRIKMRYGLREEMPVRVSVFKMSEERLDFREMLDYLPDRPEWYEKWKKKKTFSKKRNDKVWDIHNTFTLYTERKAFLEACTQRDDINRYELLWLWANNAFMIGEEISLDDVYEVNNRFESPLTEKEIKSKMSWFLKQRRHYKQTNATICEKLGIEKEELMTTREREKLEKIARGETRKQIAEKNFSTFKAYREKGLTHKEISEKMGMSIKTMEYYQRKLNKETAL